MKGERNRNASILTSPILTVLSLLWTGPINYVTSDLIRRVEDVGVLGGKDRDATPVRVTSQGVVTWYPISSVTTSCEMDISQYPFDTQVCTVDIIGYSYPIIEMNITTG